MTEQQSRLRTIMLVGLGMCGVLGLSLWVQSAAPNVDEGVDEPGSAISRAISASTSADAHRGGVPTRRIDPASRFYEGGEDDDWDSLGTQGRIDRTEAAIAKLELEVAAATDPAARASLREDALLALSAARADYFADDQGRARYLELEAALERSE